MLRVVAQRIGAMFDQNSGTVADVIGDADGAVYQAKDRGRGRAVLAAAPSLVD